MSAEWTTETAAHEALTQRLKDAEHGRWPNPRTRRSDKDVISPIVKRREKLAEYLK